MVQDVPDERKAEDQMVYRTVRQVAQATGMRRPLLQRKIAEGLVKAHQYGAMYLIPVCELERLFPGVQI